MSWRRAAAAAVLVILLVATVVTFLLFDRDSHSASDTLRPFLFTMTPVWVAVLTGLRALVKPGRAPH